jgi:hypothetical protein
MVVDLWGSWADEALRRDLDQRQSWAGKAEQSASRISMLRRFAEVAEISIDDLTVRRKRVARKLEVELADAGCSLDPKRFIEILEERHGSMHPNWTVDDLVCHPDEAKMYCEQIRAKVGAPVPDHVILRRLMNARKAH